MLQLLTCITDFTTQIPSAYCIYSPLAIESLANVLKIYTPDSDAQQTLFADFTRGVAYLHSKDIMHLDIKPGNLGVVSFDPPKGVLLDLDTAIEGKECYDHMKGTITFLAPEIVNIKWWNPKDLSPSSKPPPFTKSVDIWALGLSMFTMESRTELSWRHYLRPEQQGQPGTDSAFVNHIAHDNFRQHLRKRMTTCADAKIKPLFRLIERMTRWSKVERVSTEKLLRDVELLLEGRREGTITLRRVPKRHADD